MKILIPIVTVLMGLPTQVFASEPCGERNLTSKTQISADEAELRDQLLAVYIDQARAIVQAGGTSPELAEQIRWTANEGVDIKDNDISSLTSLQMEALKLVSLLNPKTAEWERILHFDKEPVAINVGAFPQHGIGTVMAHVTVQDLVYNKSLKERLVGITFVVPIVNGDDRSVYLPKVTKSAPMKWGKINDRARRTRRNQVLYRHMRMFNHQYELEHSIRLIHVVISLERDTKKGVLRYVLPGTNDNSQMIFKAKENIFARASVAVALEDVFEAARTGRNDFREINGYQNGDARNKRMPR